VSNTADECGDFVDLVFAQEWTSVRKLALHARGARGIRSIGGPCGAVQVCAGTLDSADELLYSSVRVLAQDASLGAAVARLIRTTVGPREATGARCGVPLHPLNKGGDPLASSSTSRNPTRASDRRSGV
jgi:hypothetical protein